MKLKVLALALLTAGAVGAGAPLLLTPIEASAATAPAFQGPDPAAQIEDLARHFRNGDLTRLAQGLVPPSKWEEIRLVYELKRLEPIDDEDRAEFAEKIGRLTAPDAVDTLMAEIEPKMIEARPQYAGAMLMAFGGMQMAVASPESDLTEEQRAALQAAIPGVQRWATSVDFLDAALLRDALTLISDAARNAQIDDLDALRALPLEGALDRASTILTAAKEAARLYGLDLDAIADSLDVETLEVDGDRARVRVTVSVFGAPVFAEHELRLVEGRWYGKDAIRHFEFHHGEHRPDERHDG